MHTWPHLAAGVLFVPVALSMWYVVLWYISQCYNTNGTNCIINIWNPKVYQYLPGASIFLKLFGTFFLVCHCCQSSISETNRKKGRAGCHTIHSHPGEHDTNKALSHSYKNYCSMAQLVDKTKCWMVVMLSTNSYNNINLTFLNMLLKKKPRNPEITSG